MVNMLRHRTVHLGIASLIWMFCMLNVHCENFDGGWTTYGTFSPCTKSCGGGTHFRERSCTNPPPANGGAQCTGAAKDTKPCHANACPTPAPTTTTTTPRTTPMPTTLAAGCNGTTPADIVFILDASGSVGAANFQKTLDFVNKMVNGFPISATETQVGLVTFDSKTYLQFHLNKFHTKGQITSAVSGTKYTSGTTHTAEALEYVRQTSFQPQNGMRGNAAHIAIIVTDGQSANPASTSQQAKLLRDAGITVFSIGVGSGAKMAELNAMATNPDSSHVFQVTNFDSLNTIKGSLAQKTCEVKATTMPPTTPAPRADCNAQADIVFLLDSSGSVGASNFQKMLGFVKDVVNNFNIGPHDVQVGVDTFQTSVKSEFNMNKYMDKNAVQQAINNVHYVQGLTHTGEAIRFLYNNSFSAAAGNRPGVPDIAIVVTDGQSNNAPLTAAEAKKARDAGVIMLAIGVGSGVKMAELNSIATDPDNTHVFTAQSFDALKSLKDLLSTKACSVSKPNVTATTQPVCAAKADIVFVLDSSGSIGVPNYQKMLDFVKGVVSKFDIGPDKVRVGTEIFSGRTYIQFNLNAHNSKASLVNAIGHIPYKRGTTNTGQALKDMYSKMFTAANGDRPGVPNIAIVVTDGKSTQHPTTVSEAKKARDQGINIFAVGVGSGVDKSELGDIATDPDNTHVLTVTDFNKLDQIQAQLSTKACQDLKSPQQQLTGFYDHGVVLTSYAKSVNGYSHVSMIPTEPGNVGNYSGTRPGVRMFISASPTVCAVDYGNKEIYVFDENTGQLELFTNASAQMNQTGTMKLKTVHSGLPRSGVQVTLDWVSHNLYWTESTFNWVLMQPGGMIADPSLYKVVVHEYLHHPHGITIDSVAGYIFITMVGGNDDKIERFSLTGQNRKPIVTSSLSISNQVMSDPVAQRLYWQDISALHSSDYNGENKKTILKRYYFYMFGTAIFQDLVFFTDVNSASVVVLNTTSNQETSIVSASDGYLSVCMFHPDVQPGVDRGRCSTYGCQDMCVDEPNSATPTCLCREGFDVSQDGKQCIENEGSYKRAIIMTDGKQICFFDVRLVFNHHGVFKSKCIYNHAAEEETITYLDVNTVTREVYFATEYKVFKISIDQDQPIPTRIISASVKISGLSYDWINKDLYWTESQSNSAHVISMVTSAQKMLLSGSTNAREILVFPHDNLLLWVSENEANETEIRNATLAFTSQTVVANVTASARQLRRDTIHHWVVFLQNNLTIALMDYNGSFLQTLATSSTDTIITFDIYKEMILQVQTDDSGVSNFVSSSSSTPQSITASGEVKVDGVTSLNKTVAVIFLDVDLQPAEKDECSDNNGGCDHVCLQSTTLKTCVCEFGFTLADDGKKCTSTLLNDNFLLMTDVQHDQIFQIPLDETLPVRGVNLPDTGTKGGVAFNAVNKSIIWSNYDERKIWKMNLDQSESSVLTEVDFAFPDGIAVDPTSGNVYYTAQSDLDSFLSISYVAVVSPDGTHYTLIDNMTYPRDIALFPKKGLMFFVESDVYGGAVYKANMDGTVVDKILDSDAISGPSGLAVDYVMEKLYVTDGNLGGLYVCDFSGNDLQELRTDGGVGQDEIILLGDYIYYVGGDLGHITKIEKANVSNAVNIRSHAEFGRPQSMAGYRSDYPYPEAHVECSLNDGHGDCSHLCLPTTTGHTCACQDGYELLSDGKTCENVPRCPSYVLNADVVEDDTCLRTVGSMCEFTCRPKYRKKSNIGKLTCTRNETWDMDGPCEPIRCPPLPVAVIPGVGCNLTADTVCSNYTCRPGYESSPDLTSLNCALNGTWTTAVSDFCKLKCPDGVSHGKFVGNCAREPASTCSFSCDEMYKPRGSADSIACQRNGSWASDISLLCEDVMCSDLVEHGTIEEECTRKVDSRCTFNCFSGYTENDDSPLLFTCRLNGKWTHEGTGVAPCIKAPGAITDTTAIAVVSVLCGIFFVVIIILAVIICRSRGMLGSTKTSKSFTPSHGIENPQYESQAGVQQDAMEGNKEFAYATLQNDRVELTVPSNKY